MEVFDPAAGLLLGDPDRAPFPLSWKPEGGAVRRAGSSLILSASGWRKVFAAGGGEDSPGPEVNPEDLFLGALAAEVFASFVKEKTGKESPRILVGCDSRPTGPGLADVILRVFLSRGLRPDYLFITAAPEIMARAQTDPTAGGFAYISASHNPLGHNGFKFGLGGGGVLGGEAAAELMAAFKTALEAPEQEALWPELVRRANGVPAGEVRGVFEAAPENKARALEGYLAFTQRVVSGKTAEKEQEAFFNHIKAETRTTPLGILGEFNGSARGLSIDRALFESAGLGFFGINEAPRQVVHAIVPEGASLDLCRRELEKLHQKDPAYILGYVPDNDGDRGNLVYWNSGKGRAEVLQAQEVFALAVLGELAYAGSGDFSGGTGPAGPLGVAANGPTSLRIEEIAAPLGARVFRAEVGEANVVARAKELRAEGWRIPILGEGSNGGSITHPASVRDPLNTLFAILKLLLLRGDKNTPGLFERWCRLCGREDTYRRDFDLGDIIASIPAYTSTPAFEDRAAMKIRSQDHRRLKSAYEDLFLRDWEKKRRELEDLGLVSWKEINYEGTRERQGFGPGFRSGRETGGLKIQFYDSQNKPAGFIWMRGSGTEPVFRVMAEIRGSNPPGEARLLDWHRALVEEADKIAAGT